MHIKPRLEYFNHTYIGISNGIVYGIFGLHEY